MPNAPTSPDSIVKLKAAIEKLREDLSNNITQNTASIPTIGVSIDRLTESVDALNETLKKIHNVED